MYKQILFNRVIKGMEHNSYQFEIILNNDRSLFFSTFSDLSGIDLNGFTCTAEELIIIGLCFMQEKEKIRSMLKSRN